VEASTVTANGNTTKIECSKSGNSNGQFTSIVPFGPKLIIFAVCDI
jgi:hypothetical protein